MPAMTSTSMSGVRRGIPQATSSSGNWACGGNRAMLNSIRGARLLCVRITLTPDKQHYAPGDPWDDAACAQRLAAPRVVVALVGM